MFRIELCESYNTVIINESEAPLYGTLDDDDDYIILPKGELAVSNIDLPHIVWSYNAA